MGRRVWYASREQVMDAFDVKESSHRSAQIDRAIEAASDAVDQLVTRHKHGFAPVQATRYFPWPGDQYAPSWRLWLDENELIEADSITAGATVLTSGDYFLEPVNSGPPYTYIEINLNSSGAFDNNGTHQRAIAVQGLWGYSDDQAPAGALAEALDATETAVDVTNASLVGVGDLLTVDAERMRVTGRLPLDTGDTLQADMGNLKNAQILTVTDGTAFSRNEVLLVDAERMLVTAVAGNDLMVVRGWDGSTLAAHATGAAVYAFRTLEVERGAQGSTAGAHSSGAAVTRWLPPYLANELCIAEAMTFFEQEVSAYARRVGSDEAERDSGGTENFTGRGLDDIRKSCRMKYGRKFRKRAV